MEIDTPKRIPVIDPFDPNEAPDAGTAPLSGGPEVLLTDDDHLLIAEAEDATDDDE